MEKFWCIVLDYILVSFSNLVFAMTLNILINKHMFFVFLLNQEKLVVLKDRQDGYGSVLVAYKNNLISSELLEWFLIQTVK